MGIYVKHELSRIIHELFINFFLVIPIGVNMYIKALFFIHNLLPQP